MRSSRRWIALVLVLWFTAAVLGVGAAEDDRVIVPGRPAGATAPVTKDSPGTGGLTIAIVLLLAGAGGWMLWKNRGLQAPRGTPKNLAIEETRSLGNRQFLVVASYRDKKFLLGVCQGRIDLLSPLDGDAAGEKKS